MSAWARDEAVVFPDGSRQEPELLFMSSHRSIRARGIGARITTPAADGSRGDGAFQRTVRDALEDARRAGQKRPVVIGAIPFDLTQPSCLYVPRCHEFFDRATIPGQVAPDGSAGTVVDARSIPDEHRFKQGVDQAIANFRHSDIRKAVLSRIYEIRLSQPVDVERIIANLVAQNPHGYHFRVPMHDGSELIGASPELLLRKVGARVHTHPLAGSAKRQPDPELDQMVGEELLRSSKDAYEHRLVVDEIRRVLAPHCSHLQIPDGPALLSTAAMWHLASSIDGVLAQPGLSVLQLACQLHPTPAVCGFPTGLSRKLIDLIEPFERGLFTGMVGWCDAEGDGEWVVSIRCGTVKRNLVRLFAGAGIVEASSPESEWRETQAKLGTMLNAFGITLGAAAQ